MALLSPDGYQVASLSWNQDNSCFAVATDRGFAIYNSQPLKELVRRDIGSVRLVAMLNRSSTVALVGGGLGRDPIDSPNKVLIWDDCKEKIVATIEYKLPVLNVEFRRDRLVVVLHNHVHVYEYPGGDVPFKPVHKFETFDNPSGLVATCPSVGTCVVAMPGRQLGHVHVVDVTDQSKQTPIMLKAHEHALACLTISVSGQWLATASTNGTLVRVFDLGTRQLAHELRRGYAPTTIFGLRFNLDCSLLTASSERTVHVFSLRQPEKNVTSGLYAMGEYLPMLKRKAGRSFIMLSTPCPCLCAFGADGKSVLAVCHNQTFYQFAFNELGPCPEQHRFWRLLKPDESLIFRLPELPRPQPTHRDAGAPVAVS